MGECSSLAFRLADDVAEQYGERLLPLDYSVEQQLGDPRLDLRTVDVSAAGCARHRKDVLRRALAVSLLVIRRRTGEDLAIERRTEAVVGRLPAAGAARDKAAKMPRVIDEQHAEAFPRRPHRAGDAARRAADDDEVVRLAVHVLWLRSILRGLGRRSRHDQDLPIGDEPRLERRIVHRLHRHAGVDRHRGRGGGGLARHHEHRLHADAREGDVACRDCERDKQVVALGLLRDDRPVADSVGPGAFAAFGQLALAGHDAALDDPADLVGVDAVAAQAHRISGHLLAARMMLGHHEVADHPPPLADIELMGPATRVAKLVARQAEPPHVGPHLLRHPRVGGQKVEESTLVMLVLAKQFLPPLGAGLAPAPAHAGEIAAERRRIEVVFLVWHGVVLREPAEVHVVAVGQAGLDEPHDDLVAGRVVAGGRLDRQPVGGGGETEPEAVGLHARGRLAGRAGFARIDQGEQAARRIPLEHVRVEREVAIPHALTTRLAAVRPRLLVRRSRTAPVGVADAGQRLVILVAAFAGERVRDARGGHEVALVGRVDEHLRGDRPPRVARAGDDDAADPRPILGRLNEPRFTEHGHSRLLDEFVEHLLGHVRLDCVGAAGAAATAPDRLVWLIPRELLAVAGHEPREKLASDAADRPWITDIDGGEAARGHAAEVPPRLDEHRVLPHAGRLHGRHHAPRGAAIDGDVAREIGRRGRSRRQAEHRGQRENATTQHGNQHDDNSSPGC